MSKYHSDREKELDRDLRPHLYGRLSPPTRRMSWRDRSLSPLPARRHGPSSVGHERRSSVSSRISAEDRSESAFSRRMDPPEPPSRRESVSADEASQTPIKPENSLTKANTPPRGTSIIEPLPHPPSSPPLSASRVALPTETFNPPPISITLPTEIPNPPPDSVPVSTTDASFASTSPVSPTSPLLKTETEPSVAPMPNETSKTTEQVDKRAMWAKRISTMAGMVEIRVERKALDRELLDLRALGNASGAFGDLDRQLVEKRHSEIQANIEHGETRFQEYVTQLSANDFWEKGAERATYDDLAKNLSRLEGDYQKTLAEMKKIKPVDGQGSNSMDVDLPSKSKYTDEELNVRAQELDGVEKQLEDLWDRVQGELGQYQNDLVAREDSLGDEIDARIQEYFASDSQEKLLDPVQKELQLLREQQDQLKETTDDQEKLVLELSDDIQRQWERIAMLNHNQAQLHTRIERCMERRDSNRLQLDALQAALAAHGGTTARVSPQPAAGEDVIDLLKSSAQGLVRQEMFKAFTEAKTDLENMLNDHRALVNNTLMTKVVATMQAVDEISRHVSNPAGRSAVSSPLLAS